MEFFVFCVVNENEYFMDIYYIYQGDTELSKCWETKILGYFFDLEWFKNKHLPLIYHFTVTFSNLNISRPNFGHIIIKPCKF